jgi:hypothetical protein
MVLLYAEAHFEHVQVIRCDIKPGKSIGYAQLFSVCVCVLRGLIFG